jgi:hypothetical protein
VPVLGGVLVLVLGVVPRQAEAHLITRYRLR